MPETPFSGWTVFWLLWSAALVLDFVAAAVRKHRTLSEHIWGRWFVEPWKRALFLLFWLECGIHFAFAGQGWFASGWAVAATASPVAALVIWREQDMFGKIWNWIKGAGSATGKFVLSHGPLWSSLLVGASVVVPGAAPILKSIAAAIAGMSGGSVDQGTVQSFGEVLSGALLLIGSLRKFWALLKPMLASPALPPAK